MGLCMLVLVVSVWRSFYGSAVSDDCVIYLSNTELQESGSRVIIDRDILVHLSNHAAFNFYAKRLNLEGNLRSGRYELREGMSVIEVVRMFKLGLQSPVTLTFNNIRTLEQLAGRVSEQLAADSTSLLRAMTTPRDGLKVEEMVSLFIPNSYEMWWTTTPEHFVDRMSRESDRFWNEARERKRKALNLTRSDVATLASIIYEEASHADEMPRIAGVYINRLRRRMRLQADPTVKFALGDFTLQRVLTKHLSYPSPYNTYLHAGLPPGAICLPTIAALDSVLDYERHSYLYFCASPKMNGYHNFATNYSQHLKNAAQYSAELNRRGIK